jgi:hypothetical protein
LADRFGTLRMTLRNAAAIRAGLLTTVAERFHAFTCRANRIPKVLLTVKQIESAP